MMETTIKINKDATTPGCPQCHAVERKCTKTGPVYRRKTKENPRTKVQAYVCTECGYKGRGNMFHMTEEMGIDKGIVIVEVAKPQEENDESAQTGS